MSGAEQVRVWFRTEQGRPLRTIELWDEPVEALLSAEEIALDEQMLVEDVGGELVSASLIDDNWPFVILPADEQADEALLDRLMADLAV